MLLVIVVIAGIVAVTFVAVVMPHLALVLVVSVVVLVVVIRVAGSGPGGGGAAGDRVSGDRHGSLCEGVTVERSPGEGDRGPSQDAADEVRVGERHGVGDPPEDAIAGQRSPVPADHREARARHSAGAEDPELDGPAPVR